VPDPALREIDSDWFAQWLDAVRDGRSAMSQRALAAIDRHGGLNVAIDEARDRALHLVELTDDNGRQLVAASLHPFRTLC
jgi:hypothetical protein